MLGKSQQINENRKCRTPLLYGPLYLHVDDNQSVKSEGGPIKHRLCEAGEMLTYVIRVGIQP